MTPQHHNDDTELREAITAYKRYPYGTKEAPHITGDKLLELFHQYAQSKTDEAFERGRAVGQYQAADKMYGSVTQMWLFKDDTSPVLNDPDRADNLLKDCEAYMNSNAAIYQSYIAEQRQRNNERKGKL